MVDEAVVLLVAIQNIVVGLVGVDGLVLFL